MGTHQQVTRVVFEKKYLASAGPGNAEEVAHLDPKLTDKARCGESWQVATLGTVDPGNAPSATRKAPIRRFITGGDGYDLTSKLKGFERLQAATRAGRLKPNVDKNGAELSPMIARWGRNDATILNLSASNLTMARKGKVQHSREWQGALNGNLYKTKRSVAPGRLSVTTLFKTASSITPCG
jgi:hypothetical protein